MFNFSEEERQELKIAELNDARNARLKESNDIMRKLIKHIDLLLEKESVN